MEYLSKEAENCRLALDQLRQALREKDELQKQNLEQKCILSDQEDEIKRLLILIQQTSSTHNDQEVKFPLMFFKIYESITCMYI